MVEESPTVLIPPSLGKPGGQAVVRDRTPLEPAWGTAQLSSSETARCAEVFG